MKNKFLRFICAVSGFQSLTLDILGLITTGCAIAVDHWVTPVALPFLVFAWAYLPIFSGALVYRFVRPIHFRHEQTG